MENLENTSVAETTEAAPAAAPESAVTESQNAGTEIGNADAAEKEAVAEAVAEYQANYKFRAFDEEKEFDEWARPLVKSKELEEKFRDLFSAKYGVERYKEDLHKFKEENTSLNGGLDSLRECVRTGDFDTFFKQTNIPLEKVWNWVKEKLAYQELSPEDRKRYDEHWGLKRQNSELTKNQQMLESQFEQAQIYKKEMELQFVTSSPEVSQIQQEVDTRAGQPGKFRELVIQKGLATEQLTGRECTAQQAVQAVIQDMKYLGYGGSHATQVAGQPGRVVSPQNKPTIPNIKGQGSSPVKAKPKTIAELRRNIEKRFSQASE